MTIREVVFRDMSRIVEKAQISSFHVKLLTDRQTDRQTPAKTYTSVAAVIIVIKYTIHSVRRLLM